MSRDDVNYSVSASRSQGDRGSRHQLVGSPTLLRLPVSLDPAYAVLHWPGSSQTVAGAESATPLACFGDDTTRIAFLLRCSLLQILCLLVSLSVPGCLQRKHRSLFLHLLLPCIRSLVDSSSPPAHCQDRCAVFQCQECSVCRIGGLSS